MGKKVIIAHDDVDLEYLKTVTGSWSVRTTDNGNEALKLIQRFREAVAAVVIDLDLPNGEALTVLRELREGNPELPVVALTRSDNPAEAAEAVGAGATECAFKPIAHEELIRILQRITKSGSPARYETHNPKPQKSEFLHLNREMREIQRSLRMLGPWDVPVVFLGETGVGKEVAARELHRLSTRAHKPFIKINCAAVPSELLESELFGYEKGAFTGALRSKPGKFELADGGTILLDEIGDMHANLQAKLLHVLQDGEFDRLGARQSMRVDVRVVAATHRDLRRSVENKSFREDLFYRLNVASIHIPALRDRKDEIIPLAEQFLVKHSRTGGSELPEIPMPLRQALIDYPWPGNVRELENVVRRFLVFRQADALAAELWQRTVESAHASGNTAPSKMKAPTMRAPAMLSNGSNGSNTVNGFSNGHVFANGAAASATAPSGIQARNGSVPENGRGQAEGFHESLHPANGRVNGNGTGYTNGSGHHPEAALPESSTVETDAPSFRFDGQQQGAEEFVASPVAPSYAYNDFSEHANGAGNSGARGGDGRGDPRSPEQVSTLAQVEELSKEFERRTILAALERATWNRKKAAKMLEIDYKGLLYKMKKLEIGQDGSSD